MSPVTIKDVARHAKVSVATVSRAINAPEKVKPETRIRVVESCQELGYFPNLSAKRLKLGRTHSIMAVLPFLTLPSIVERLRGVQQALAPSDYDLIPFSVESPDEREEYLESLSNRSRADGVLIISLPITNEQVQRFMRINMPVVLIDSNHPSLTRINVDDVYGGKLATDHLIDLGHRQIGFISDYLDNPFHFSSMARRFEGYKEALAEHDIRLNPLYQKQGPHGRQQAKQMALELLSLPDPPTAVFAASDTQAIGVLDAAKKLGLAVPDELSVIGYDDIRDADYVDLTTIRQPLFETGLEGGKSLIKVIENGKSSLQETILEISLITRNTTAPPSR